ncbi:MAG: heme-binding domain-containing protein [Bacteroidota bacterium]
MKRRIALFVIAGGLFILFQANRPDPELMSQIPEELSTLLVSSCYDCHTTGARSEDALKAVNFTDWEEYRVSKKVAVLGDICKVVEKEKMPPEKYLDRNPDKKLSDTQKKLICDWTKEAADKLLGAN